MAVKNRTHLRDTMASAGLRKIRLNGGTMPCQTKATSR
jgi:hypothetical protein